MKAPLYLSLAAGLLLAGCGEKSDNTAPGTNSASGVAGPADYVGALGNAKNKAVNTADVTSIDKAIQMFGVDKGRNPKDLNELVAEKYLPRIPETPPGMKLQYDATAGKVTVVPQ